MLLDGKTQQEAADAVGVTRQIVSEWKSRYDEQGDVALDGKKRGRRPGEQKALDPKQEALIRRLVADKCPDQLKLEFALWTREAVATLIQRETSVRLSLSAVGNYLRSWGFTAQRPIQSNRASGGGGSTVGRVRLSGDCQACEGRKGRDPMGR